MGLHASPLWDLLDRDQPVPLFVYGTLRPGGRLHGSWIKPAVVRSEPATAYGYGLYMMRGIPYPFMSPNPSRFTVGDVLWVDPTHSQVRETIHMEVGAGYTWSTIDVDTASVTQPVKAMAFVWKNSIRHGNAIDDGDFFNYHVNATVHI